MFEFDARTKEEIDLATDRAAAICGGAYIEEALIYGLRFHLHEDNDVFNRMFRHSGPLALLEAKIRIAYLSKMIGRAFHDDLLVLKDIRNKFAHDLEVKSFDTDSFRDKLRNIRFLNVGIMAIELVEKRPATPRERFLSAIGEAAPLLRSRSGKGIKGDPVGDLL